MEEFKNITSNIEDNILYETLMKRKGGFNRDILTQEATSEKIQPEDDDYESKFTIRYFCIKTNDPRGALTEINLTKYNELRTNPFFQTYILRWKITGSIRSVYDQGILQEIGVIEYNERSFKDLRKSLPNLGEVVRSLTEMYKN